MRSTQSFALACLAAASSAAVLDKTTPHTRQHARDLASLHKRANCGSGLGSCGPTECCSQYGWCGTSADHCGTGCQAEFGTCSSGGDTGGGDDGGSDSGNTGGVPRPKFGSVAYGVNIATCTVPGTIAITYDDGPFTYTAELLDILAQYNATATFFINGRNWDDTRNYGDVLQRFIAEGHQVASHTYSHPDLNTITSAARRQQMMDLETIFKDFYGFIPTYMRPPFGSCNGACLTDMADLGYHVIMWNIDTLDYSNQSPEAIETSKGIFDDAVSTDAGSNAYISLEHDVHPYTVSHLSEHILQTAQSRGYRLVTVGECLGDPSGNWYRDAVTGNSLGGDGSEGGEDGDGDDGGDNGGGDRGDDDGDDGGNDGGDGGNPGGDGSGDDGDDDGNNDGVTVTPDGTCGGTTGFTCIGSWAGDCCSQWGWCGRSDGHCGAGCQSGFGTCN